MWPRRAVWIQAIVLDFIYLYHNDISQAKYLTGI